MTTKGRSFSIADTYSLAQFARRFSAAITAALLQSPAFFSCTPTSTPQYQPARVRALPVSDGRQLDVFCFYPEEPRMLDCYQRISPGDYMISGPGQRIVAALSSIDGDIYRRAGINRYEDICEETFRLEDDCPTSPLRYGETTSPGGIGGYVNLVMKPFICSITLRSVSCVRRTYFGKLFLINAISEVKPAKAGNESRVSYTIVNGESIGLVGPERIHCRQTLWCYANPASEDTPGSPLTRLVLEAEWDGQTCYYPINIPSMEDGMSYSLDLTINRMGTPDPDIPAINGIVTVETHTQPWDTKPPVTLYY